jgi:DNA-binding HxlR family transcriptional regulator
VRELLFGSRHFNAIKRGLPGISRSLLVSRLRLLADSGVLERHAGKRPTEYVLTETGIDLKKVLEGLGQWGVKWAFGEPKPDELDAALLLWMMRRRIHRHLLPSARTVLEFDLTGRGGRRLWLVLEPREISLCLKPPGFDSDLVVRADLSLLYRVWLGYVDYDAAVCPSSGSLRARRQFDSARLAALAMSANKIRHDNWSSEQSAGYSPRASKSDQIRSFTLGKGPTTLKGYESPSRVLHLRHYALARWS